MPKINEKSELQKHVNGLSKQIYLMKLQLEIKYGPSVKRMWESKREKSYKNYEPEEEALNFK